jgi:hypothetical protein
MWEQYKRTFAFMQSAIAVFTVAIYLTLHHLVLLAALFFVVMQLAAVVGAMWAWRLKAKLGNAALHPNSSIKG